MNHRTLMASILESKTWLIMLAISVMTSTPMSVPAKEHPCCPVEVVLKAQNTIGTRPDGSTVLIDIKLEVVGSDTSSLTGTGRHFGSGGAHSYWDVTGGIDGNILTLVGTVNDTNNPALLGSPIKVIADLDSEFVTFEFGPLTGGPFEGHTIVTQGFGRIQIND
jgi:hypothetical protein